MDDPFESSGTFTRNAWEWLYQTVDDKDFFEKDAERIYQTLKSKFQPVHFGRFLRHFLFKKTGMEGDFSVLPLADYKTILLDSFRETGTPASFTPTSSKLSALAHNWLTQQSVRRSTVLLLGFGLKMSAAEVNEFLCKALMEQRLNDQSPFEALCAYCYQHGRGYYGFQRLWQLYQQLDLNHPDLNAVRNALPPGMRNADAAAQEDARLLHSLAELKKRGGPQDDTAFQQFKSLYFSVCCLTADPSLDGKYLDPFDPILYELSAVDIENMLYSAYSKDSYGNLASARTSSLNALFDKKRFTRKRINDILRRVTEPERFDLITLNFLIFSLEVDREPNAQKRFSRFTESTNRILDECFMGPLYVTNPYECFLVMCMLSVSPLETFNDVIELSFRDRES